MPPARQELRGALPANRYTICIRYEGKLQLVSSAIQNKRSASLANSKVCSQSYHHKVLLGQVTIA